MAVHFLTPIPGSLSVGDYEYSIIANAIVGQAYLISTALVLGVCSTLLQINYMSSVKP